MNPTFECNVLLVARSSDSASGVHQMDRSFGMELAMDIALRLQRVDTATA